jgi:FecR protein
VGRLWNQQGQLSRQPSRGARVSLGHLLRILVAVVAVSTFSDLAATTDARAQTTVGMVTKVENQAQVGGVLAAVGTPVHMGDTLNTAAKARLQVTFRDNTNLTLGENATVVVDRYVFDPDAGVGKATLNATKGALRIVTGRLSDMPKKDIKVTTSFAALAVRGTDFWAGVVKGKSGVLLVHNSRLEVRKEYCPELTDNDRRRYCRPESPDYDRSRCCCAVTLDQAEEGTYIDPQTGCPGTARHWTPEEVQSALSTVGFQLAFAPSQAIPAAAGAAAAAAGFGVSTSTNNEGPPRPKKPKPTSP